MITAIMDSRALRRSLQEVRRSAYKGLRTEFRAIGRDFKKDFVSARLSGRPGIKGRRSMLRTATKGSRLTNLLLRLNFFPRYIGIHEKGGTIKAKSAYSSLPGGPYLRVPVGISRTERRRKASFVNTFIARGKGGQFTIFQRTGAGNIRPLFVLKKQVVIPARLDFYATWRKGLSVVLKRVQNALHLTMTHAFGKR